MKIKDLEAITDISFDHKDCTGLSYDAVVKVVPGMATTDKGYANFLTKATLAPWGDKKTKTTKNLLFLEDYGDDMPETVKARIFGKDVKPIGVIDVDTAIFHWGCVVKDKGKRYLSLVKMGELRRENAEGIEVLPKDFMQSLNQKRPYHFEIDYWHIQPFLEGEMGWKHLRDGLQAIVRCGVIRYKTGYDRDVG